MCQRRGEAIEEGQKKRGLPASNFLLLQQSISLQRRGAFLYDMLSIPPPYCLMLSPFASMIKFGMHFAFWGGVGEGRSGLPRGYEECRFASSGGRLSLRREGDLPLWTTGRSSICVRVDFSSTELLQPRPDVSLSLVSRVLFMRPRVVGHQGNNMLNGKMGNDELPWSPTGLLIIVSRLMPILRLHDGYQLSMGWRALLVGA